MGYLFLTLALFAGVTKGFCGKKTSGYVEKTRDAFLINIIRMVLCTITGIIVVLCSGHASFLIPDTKGLLICLLSGVSTAFFVAFWLLAIRKSAYMLMDVFLLAGTLIPMRLSSAFFNESIKLHQWGGFLLLLIAVIIMCSYSSSVKEKFSISAFILLALTGIMCGITSFSQKLFVNLCSETPATVFNLYTYVFSAVTLIIFYFIFSKTDIKKDSYISFSSIPKRMFIYILIMAVCLFANSFFNTKAAYFLDSAKMYPFEQGASLVLSSLMSAIFFKEKLTLKAVTGIIITFIALLIINVL
jgi:drug/metabolite transporter (DMT)-like permease